MIGIDSSALIDLFRNDKGIINLLETIEEEIVLNQISYLEIMFGLDFNDPKYNEEENFYDNLFNYFNNLNLDTKASKKSSIIFFKLKKIGKMIELFDCTIAGIYLSNNVSKIITKNVKHFENIEGLKVISY